jgi:hypothetical protein
MENPMPTDAPATVPFAARPAPPDREAELLAAVRQLRAELTQAKRLVLALGISEARERRRADRAEAKLAAREGRS